MNNKKGILLFVFLLAGYFVTACTTDQSMEDAQSAKLITTVTPSFIMTPTLTLTPTPTATSTPVPVSLMQAVQMGKFGIIKEYDKGLINESLFSPDGTMFVAVVSSGIYVYDVATWEEINYFPVDQDTHISTIKFSRDGKLLAYGEYYGEHGETGGVIRIWDTDKFESIQVIKAYKNWVSDLDISPDGKYIVSSGRNGDSNRLNLWNISDGSSVASQYQKWTSSVNYSQDGTWIMEGTTIRSSKDLQYINEMKEINYFNLVSPFTNVVVSLTNNLDLVIYDVDTQEVTNIEKPFEDVSWEYDITFMDFMDESHILVKEEKYNLLHYIDINTGEITNYSTEQISSLNTKNPDILKITKENEIIDLGFYPFRYSYGTNISMNGKYLMSEDGVFDTETWSIVPQDTRFKQDWSKTFNLLNGDIARIDMSNGPLANYKFTVMIFNGEDLTYKTRKEVNYTLDKWYDIVKISPDGKLLSVGVQYGSLSIFDVDKNELIAVKKNTEPYYKGFDAPTTFSRILFDENSKMLRTTSFDGTLIKYWDLPVLEPINEADGEDNPFITDEFYVNIVWSDDLVFTRDWDTLKIWAADKTLIAEYPLVKGDALEVNLDGTMLYTCSANGVFTIWGYKP